MEPPGASARTTLLRTVRGLLDELGSSPGALDLGADLERDLGLGSLERAELLARLEQQLSIRLPDAALADPQTLGTLLRLVELGAEARSDTGPGAAAAAGAPQALAGEWKLPRQAETLVDLARFRAEVDGGRIHLRLLGDDGEEVALTFGELWERALRAGAGLSVLGLRPGDRVALVLPTGADFFIAFLGALCAGCVPVPLYPPLRMAGLGSYLERQGRLLDNAGPAALIVDSPLHAVGTLLAERTASKPVVTTIATLELTPSEGLVRPGPDDLCLIQYTSGSTGDPKGVALSHRAMIANIRSIGLGLELTPRDVAINWLPLYHDMGLIGLWWTPLYHGLPVAMLSPLQFLNRPERWLWAFHRFRGTAAAVPNFAFDLCCRKISDRAIEGLDLSSWRVALCGAEPVRPDTLERFIRRFEPYGFHREAMMPTYGLAETTVALTVTPPGRGPRYDRVERGAFFRDGRAQPSGAADALAMVSSGRPLPRHEVRIVDRDAPGRELPERREGRVLFRTPSAMEGYFRRPDLTAAVRLGDWIDTGDLAYLAGGELYVTGRIKDLVIKGGRKYHPQDIERAAQRVEGIRQGCVIAFDAATERGEAIVVIAETQVPPARREQLIQAVVAAVFEEIGTPPDRVELVPPRTVLKTSSGKLKRRETRALYLESRLLRRARPRWLDMLAIAVPSLGLRAAAAARAAGRFLFGFYVAALSLPVIGTGAALALLACRRPETTWSVVRGSLRLWGRMSGLLPRVSGRLPAGGAVLVSNHGSYLDAMVLIMAVERPVLFTAKQEVFEWPVIGRVMRKLGHLPVDRSSAAGRLRSYREMAGPLRDGQLIHIFPEGTFTRTPGIRRLHLGAFHLAAELGRPVIPLALRGPRGALPDGAWLPRPARIAIEVSAPITPEPMADFREILRLRDAARAALARGSGEPPLESAAVSLPG